METKYYIPTIDEFKIGFRYEQFTHEGGMSWSGRLHDAIEKMWIKNIFDIDSSYSLLDTRNYIDSGFIRVKRFDADDIIEAGWKLLEERGETISDYIIKEENEDDDIYLTFRGNCHVEIHNNGDNIEDYHSFFEGKIKNYNELLKVMEMLNISPSKNVES